MFCWRNSGRAAASALACAVLLTTPRPADATAAGEPEPVTSASASASATAPAIELGELLSRLSALKGLSASFREEKHMALLAVPLVNEGEIHFVPPGTLVRHTHTPSASTVLITGDVLSVADGGGRERIDLAGNPAVRLFVDSFVKIYAGDQTALERMYTLTFTPRGRAWTLTLRPKLAPMNQVIERIELEGHEITLAGMRVVEVGGDETVTTFHDVRPREFSAAEHAELFRLPG